MIGDLMIKILKIILLILISFNNAYAKNTTVSLYKCVDGDTAYFKNENDEIIKARFLAIDTPEYTKEKEEYGKEASDFTCNKLKNAKKIELEYDNNSDKKDKYDRDLVWVFVDNKLLQELIIEEGLAEVKYLYGDYKYTNLLLEKEKIAKNKEINIWSLDIYNNKTEKDSSKIDYIIFFVLLSIVILYSAINHFKKKLN